MKTSLKNLLFPVFKALVSEMLGVDTISSTEYGIFGYVNGRDKKPVLINTCSDVYELLPNSDLFPVIEKILNDAKIKFEVTYKMIDFSRFYADYTLNTGGVSVGNSKDEIFPILRIEHSYNGLLKYKMTFGWFRMICTNGLTIPVEGKENENITIVGKHTAKILESLKQLIEKITYFTENGEKFTKKYKVIADRWVKNWSARVEEVINATGIGKRGTAQILAKIQEEAAILSDGKVNDWLIYNAFNFHIYNAKTNDGKEYATAPNLRHDQDKKIFETIYKNPGKIKVKKEKTTA